MAMKVFPWLGTLTKAAKMGYAELLHNKAAIAYSIVRDDVQVL
jgi:hypothetical protein